MPAAAPGRTHVQPKKNPTCSPDKSQLALAVLEEFRLIFKTVRRHFDDVESKAGIGGAQLWVLSQVGNEPGIRVTALATALAIHQSTASNLVEKLVKAKLLERKRTTNDQRVVRLYLTALGREVVARAPGPARGILPDALERLTESELLDLKHRLVHLANLMANRAPKGRKTPLAEI